METCYSGPEVAVLHVKTTGEGWNQYRLFILVLSTLLCVLKTTDEVWDPYRLVCLVLKSLFFMHKTTEKGRRPIETSISDAMHAVLRAEDHR